MPMCDYISHLFLDFSLDCQLSMSPSGSYVLEQLFTLASNPLKLGIAGDLCRAEKRVMASRSGSLVWRKLRLEHYKKHQQSWLTSNEAARTRAIAMFADVIADGTSTAASSTTAKPKKDVESKKKSAAKSSKPSDKKKTPKVKDETKEDASAEI